MVRVSNVASQNPWSKRPSDLELEAIEVIWRRFQRGERDLLEGGVAPADVARAASTTTGTVSELCLRLTEEGSLVELQGVDPESYHPRRSFAPAVLVEEGDSC